MQRRTKYILFRPNITHPNITNRHIILNEHNVDRVGNTQKEKSFKILGYTYGRNFDMEIPHQQNQLKNVKGKLHDKQSKKCTPSN